jgi:hypothetical protein
MNEGPRYNHAAKTAATIINLHSTSDDPPAVKFAKILFLILEAMEEAERESSEMRLIVSRN